MNARIDTAVLPWSQEAEQSVLGGLLLDNNAFDRASDVLQAASFFDSRHGLIFTAISSLVIANKPADVITVFERLQGLDSQAECGGIAYLNELARSVPSAANMRRYAEIVAEKAAERSLIATADKALSIAAEKGDVTEKLDRIAGLFGALERRTITQAPIPLTRLLVSAIDRYSEMAETKTSQALATGIAALDRILNGGLRGGKVYVIAARPSVGKSSVARAVGISTARHGAPTLLLSQEMDDGEVADCVVSQLGRVPSERLQTGQFNDEDWGRITDAVEDGARLPFFVDDQGSLNITEIRAKARMVKGLGVLIIDYLQLTSSTLRNATRNSEIEEVTKGLKTLAMAMNIPVVVLSQLSRDVEKRADKEPQLSDLRDSGAIEQDVDAAIFLWTAREFDDGARRIVGCKVAKHRGGKKGKFALEFWPATYSWMESTASLDAPTSTERKGGFE